jgi:pilus assembly protein CpaE
MTAEREAGQAELTAVLVSSDAELARQFAAAARESRAFLITREYRPYPDAPALESRIRLERPDVVFLDYSAAEPAASMTSRLTALRPAVCVVGLGRSRDSQVMLDALGLGASEFLHAPFEASALRDAAAGLLRHRKPEREARGEPGKVLVFSSAKPGSGASTLACQSAFALGRITGRRVLLADLNLAGGTLGFSLRLKPSRSTLDALEQAAGPDALSLEGLAAQHKGIEVLTAPERPYDGAVQPGALQRFLDEARRMYDWVVADLPVAFHRLSLQAFWESDRIYLVATAELPGLYLARKAVNLLGQLGLGRDRVEVLLNRTCRRDGVGRGDLKNVFDQRIDAGFPWDLAALNRAVTLGEPLEEASELGRAVGDFAAKLAGGAPAERRRTGLFWEASPVLSGT